MNNPFAKPPKAKKVEFSLDQIENNPVTRKQLEGFIDEISICRGTIKTQQHSISDIRTEAAESLGIPGKLLMKLVRESMQAGTIEAELNELETVQAISQAIENAHKP